MQFYEAQAQDDKHLNLLMIFHYVMGALCALTGLFFSIYIALGILFIADPSFGSPSDPPPAFMGGFFIFFGVVAAGICIGMGIVQIVVSRSLTSYKRYVFCMVVAGLNCLNFPFGTALGIFTLVVLLRPSVKELFTGRMAPTAPYRGYP
jgi:hypothetical protein